MTTRRRALRLVLGRRVMVAAMLASVPAAMLPAAVVRQDDWRPLFDGRSLAGWQETVFGGEGQIAVRDGQIVLGFGEPMTGITYAGADLPRIDYELAFEAARLAGTDFFAGVTFPVGDTHCSLILGGWGGAVVGLSNLDGLDASDNETSRTMRFEDGRWYGIRLRVTAARIAAWLDDRSIIDVGIAGRKVDVRPEMLLSRPLGFATYRTRAGLRNIRVRRLGEEV